MSQGRRSSRTNASEEEHPFFDMAAPSGRTLSVYQPDDTVNVIDLLLVTDLEVKPAANGSGKRRKA